MRIRKSFERPEGNREARLIVIACEGKMTENIYFNAVKNSICASNVHMEVLERDTTDSSPKVVFEQLNSFKKQYELDDDDELWMVIDKDKWEVKTLTDIARLCRQSKWLHFSLSNPCFELWLLLHLEEVSKMTEEELCKLRENKRVSKRGDTWLKARVRKAMGSYSESSYSTDILMPHIPEARERAEALDKNKKERWPSDIGTHVYRLIDSIMNRTRTIE